MNIGIVGYGKMGREIFRLLFDKLVDNSFVVVDPFIKEDDHKEVIKSLDKSLKRGQINHDLYAEKLRSMKFTSDLNELRSCDIVIEAAPEMLELKQELFQTIFEIVSPRCVLLTNTSSLRIADVFKDTRNLERCCGMHFYYPVKLSGYVELNILPETNGAIIRDLGPIILNVGKYPVVLSGEYHIYFNQLISCVIAAAIYLREKYNVSANELDKALEEMFSMAAPFQMLDSISLGLMGENPRNFTIERNKALLSYGCEKMQGWLNDGCPEKTGTFLSFIGDKLPDTGNDASDAALSMAALILNEAVTAKEESGLGNFFFEAVQDLLGLAEAPAYYYKKFGADAIINKLDQLYADTGFASFKPCDKELFDKYFNA
ncbi:MAG: 3-hydroxyacyl-CoA dehydrogenase family protein [Ruminococcus sp.]|nr:3-hydroxyacyl-CoA dehydrogenase family protein [Ruminococcus sp.]